MPAATSATTEPVHPHTAPEQEDQRQAPHPRWTAGRIASLVIGVLLVLMSLALLGAGGTALWADLAQREGGYVTSDVHEFSTVGSAVTTEPTSIGSAGVLYSPRLLGEIRIRVTSANPSTRLFVGIGRSSDVDRYLAGVHHTVVSDFFGDSVEPVGGGSPGTAPGTQSFWAASTVGRGTQTLSWDPANGSWRVVVMNADGRPGISVEADIGARMPAALWIAIGLLVGGFVFFAGGALLFANALPRNRTLTTERKGEVMSTSAITIPAPQELTRTEQGVDRYAGIKQYSLVQIIAVWAAAAVPMGLLAWIAAPALADRLSGAGNVPLIKAMLLLLTAGLIWQFFLVLGLVWREQRTLRWSTLRQVLWLRSPRSPKSGRIGGRLWLILIPLIVAFMIASMVPAVAMPENRDFATFLDSDLGRDFFSGAWGWFGVIVLLMIFNTVLGEELLFRGVLLPRMNRAFGRRDWLANGILFALYHVHMPWLIPANVLDTFFVAYPAKRYQSALLGIVVHSAQSLFFGALILSLVL